MPARTWCHVHRFAGRAHLHFGAASTGTNRLFDVISGDTIVLSSHPIPGNEENVYRTINRLFQAAQTSSMNSIAPVHVSGHASQEEMKLSST
jgi:ribonuclease J